MRNSNVPPPDLVTSAMSCFQTSAALRSGLELDLFTALAEGHTTPDALAVRCKAHPRGLRILADHLVMNGFLVKRGHSYDLTAESAMYLVRSSPKFLGGQAAYILSPFLWTQFGNLTESVRAGGAQLAGHAMEPDHDLWVTFARSMSDNMAVEAANVPPNVLRFLQRRTSQPLKVLDVAAGHGMFGISFAKADPSCQVVALDWPRILEVARDNAVKHGVADRYTTIPGGIQEADIGTGYDVVVVANLLHYLDPAACVQVLKKVRAAMNPGAVLAIPEFAPNDDRISPRMASFAVLCLAISPGGDAYTVNELASMCNDAGFKNIAACELSIERLVIGVNPIPAPNIIAARPVESQPHMVPHTQVQMPANTTPAAAS